MSHGKQFTLYTHIGGPNGWKVAYVLEELGLSYHSIYLDFAKGEQKAPEFTKYNPNGRIPALIDHQNGDFVIWESNAILLYIVEKYDTSKRLTVTDEKGRHEINQWLFFQASGQGPYFGQAFWFQNYHPEKIPSAIERYQKETVRVLGVLDAALAAQPSGWLVGGKPTIADFSFITWNRSAELAIVPAIAGGVDLEKQFPAYSAWHKKLTSYESVKKLVQVQSSLTK